MPNYIINDGRFGRLQYIPTTLIDFKEYYEGALTEEGIRSLYEDYIMDIPKTGMMISSSSSVGKVSVTVDVNARVAGEYSLGVMLVEDHVIAAQSGLSREYDHTNVARQLATEGLFGESLGTMTAGQVVNKQYTFDVESIYNASNLAFVVYTVFDEGKGPVVDNSIKVLVNQSGGYN